jgi:hypothetical protein
MNLNARYSNKSLIAGAIGIISLVLAGCDNTVASAATAAARHVNTGSSKGGSYEVVTERRPESLPGYAARAKAVYDLCAAAAQMVKRPVVKPFVALPPDFVTERTTHVSDGNAYFRKQEQYSIGMDSDTCDTRIDRTTSILTWQNGTEQRIEIDQEGQLHVDTQSDVDRMPPDATTNFTVPKTVRGVPLRCMAPSAQLQTLGASDLCIVTNADGTVLFDSDGVAIEGYFHGTDQELYNSTMVLEPVSAKFGISIDPKIFKQTQAN